MGRGVLIGQNVCGLLAFAIDSTHAGASGSLHFEVVSNQFLICISAIKFVACIEQFSDKLKTDFFGVHLLY